MDKYKETFEEVKAALEKAKGKPKIYFYDHFSLLPESTMTLEQRERIAQLLSQISNLRKYPK